MYFAPPVLLKRGGAWGLSNRSTYYIVIDELIIDIIIAFIRRIYGINRINKPI